MRGYKFFLTAQFVQQVFHLVGNLGNLIIAHCGGHPFHGVGAAEDFIQGIKVAGIFFQFDQASVHIVQIFLGFGKKNFSVTILHGLCYVY